MKIYTQIKKLAPICAVFAAFAFTGCSPEEEEAPAEEPAPAETDAGSGEEKGEGTE